MLALKHELSKIAFLTRVSCFELNMSKGHLQGSPVQRRNVILNVFLHLLPLVLQYKRDYRYRLDYSLYSHMTDSFVYTD